MGKKKNNEKEIIAKTVLISLATSFIVFLIVYFLRLRDNNFIDRYGFFIFFSILSYAIVMPAIKRARCYQGIACMPGMMIGMTIGMVSGFLPGFFVGATNGMFWGSVWGMTVGITIGILGGKCCGLMGMMEGIMAGFMGGLMGAMTAIMMYNDNLKAAGIIVFLVSCVILTGLNIMMTRETKEMDGVEVDEMFTIAASFILTTVTIWLIVFGPRSTLFT